MKSSPEGTNLRMEPLPKHQTRNVPVVYYLCRNRHLQHPHFIEVPLSSPKGLFLRDVIERLNVLRGRSMASMYSWSCKRSYKNGFVWHDLCEDDLILPAHGNEYVLKGSMLYEESHSDDLQPESNTNLQNTKQLQESTSSRKHQASSRMIGKETKPPEEVDFSPLFAQPSSCGMSPDSSVGKNPSWGGSTSLTEYNVYKGGGAADASTQTEESGGKMKTPESCTRGASTDGGSLEHECKETHQRKVPQEKENSEICRDEITPPASCSSTSSSGGRTETLESLIKADSNKINSFRIIEEEEVRIPSNTNFKASNVLLQLISCGSIPIYRPHFSHSKFPSPLYSSSMMLEDKEYFSGNLIETKTLKEGDEFSLKRSSSFIADRVCKSTNSSMEKVKDSDTARSKCIRSIKSSLSKHTRSEIIRSPVSQEPRNSSARANNTQPMPLGVVSCNGSSKRIKQPSLGKRHSRRSDSLGEEKVIQIEENLLQELGL